MKSLIASLILLFASNVVVAEVFDIKGFMIGMSQKDAEKLLQQPVSIAGVKSKDFEKYGNIGIVSYNNKQVDAFFFQFDSDDFNDVYGAVKSKYPNIKCEDSVVTNGIGNKFNQIRCEMHDEQQTYMVVKRFSSNIHTSLLSLYSKRYQDETRAKMVANKKDI